MSTEQRGAEFEAACLAADAGMGVDPVRTIEVVTGEIKLLQRQAESQMLGYAIEIGRRLVEAKAMLHHGAWGEYIKTQLNYSASTAQNFMRIFRECGDEQQSLFGGKAKTQALGSLPYTKALALLVLPEDERETFAAEHDLQGMSSREIQAAIRERDEARAEQKAAEEARRKMEEDLKLSNERMKGMNEELEQARKDREKKEQDLRDKLEEADSRAAALVQELEELKKQPIEVQGAAVPDEAALEQARKEGEQAARKAAEEKLKEKIEKAKQEAAEAKQRLKAAEKAREEREKTLEGEKKDAQKRLATLEKKLAAAGDKDLITFQFFFESAQADVNRMLGVLVKLRENGAKEEHNRLAAAFRALAASLAQNAPGDMEQGK